MAKIFKGPEKEILAPDTSIGIYMHEKLKAHGNRVAMVSHTVFNT
jgi:hypothetical protein